MSARPAKRRSSSKDSVQMVSDSRNSAREEEKTIPFLRRLCDMLEENGDAISFYPGCRKSGQTVLGRIVVHDRAKVESEVLPKYFNHASFASLRRQLNYFSFTRVGKGRQRGATYCNEAVVEIHDILRLKRRAVGATNATVAPQNIETTSETCSSSVHSSTQDGSHENGDNLESSSMYMKNVHSLGVVNSVVPVVHLPVAREQTSSKRGGPRSMKRTKINYHSHPSPKIISPVSTSPVPNDATEEQRVTLDLTVPSGTMEYKYGTLGNYAGHGEGSAFVATVKNDAASLYQKDDDILEGCNALLSFSSGVRQQVGFA